jgi:hypothetical protein
MTDKELLELAAKAAGIVVKPHTNYKISPDLVFTYQGRNWNPLTDDGDALRLAVNLRLIIDPVAETLDGTGPCAAVWCKPQRRYIMEPFGDDPYAATRRAITRAAAAIGKAMP